jgi:hypothetical protein
VFHEINQDKIDRVRGFDITIVTTAKTDDEGRALLTSPFASAKTRRRTALDAKPSAPVGLKTVRSLVRTSGIAGRLPCNGRNERRNNYDDDRPGRRHADPSAQRELGAPRLRVAAESKLKTHIAEILQQEGYISGWEVSDARVGQTLTLTLKYGPNRERSIAGIKRVSKPGAACTLDRDPGPRRPGRRDPVHLLRSSHRPPGRAEGRGWGSPRLRVVI